ncbi:uncharacterized protein CLUP02_04957 [Colletotrichum lupini]|uniref:Uncharacterized protein n=1 Tax=Colletotrichum lupini TaxID=145971 RepID=A0A9Q8WE73_9PEZI|nr:uncharacterized protein CLUP02_04957 [Colletotrichum lupini]UQC79477.1 hypothetical protein CLUP02_04957 [Colletotrichum lupini]
MRSQALKAPDFAGVSFVLCFVSVYVRVVIDALRDAGADNTSHSQAPPILDIANTSAQT